MEKVLYDGTEKQDTNLEYINYDEWLQNADKLKYRLNIKGDDYKNHILKVRNIIYHNKIYGFNYQEDGCNSDYVSVTFKLEEDGIIDSYNIALIDNFYKELLKDIHKHFGSDNEHNNINVGKDIISFINIIIHNINGIELFRCNKDGSCAKFFNHYDEYDPLRCNEYLYLDDEFIPSKFENECHIYQDIEELFRSLEDNDLIKLTNKKTGSIKYGVYNDNDTIGDYSAGNPLLYFCIDLDTVDEIKPYKRGFYPIYLFQSKSRNEDQYKDFEISKSYIDELNNRQRINYKKTVARINHLNRGDNNEQ